jgi:hypothetical protein
LRQSSLPAPGLKLKPANGAIPHAAAFKAQIEQFNRSGDPLLDAIFWPMLVDRRYDIEAVLTQGVPAPYDAWTAEHGGREAFFFNMDQWTGESLQRAGLSVIKHEVTHVLLADLLATPHVDNHVASLNHIMLNEGIAHYVGYARDRGTMLKDKTAERAAAERALADAIKRLQDPRTTLDQRDALIKAANTGNYWDKYAAIAGMFRVAALYEKSGAEGVRQAILSGVLPAQP